MSEDAALLAATRRRLAAPALHLSPIRQFSALEHTEGAPRTVMEERFKENPLLMKSEVDRVIGPRLGRDWIWYFGGEECREGTLERGLIHQGPYPNDLFREFGRASIFIAVFEFNSTYQAGA